MATRVKILLALVTALAAGCTPEDYEVQERSDLLQSVYHASVDDGLSETVAFDIPATVGSILIEVDGERGRYELEELVTPSGEDMVERGLIRANRGGYPGIVNWLYPNRPEIRMSPGTYTLRVRSTDSRERNIGGEDLSVRIYSMEQNPRETCGIRLDYLVDAQAVQEADALRATELMTANVINHLQQANIEVIDYSTQRIDFSDFSFDIEFTGLAQVVDEVIERARGNLGARREAIHIVMARRIDGLNNPVADRGGYSMGEPGPYDADRPTSAVLLATNEFVSDVDNYLDVDKASISLVHEIGHHLGLSHTSEKSSNRHDPIIDTPECSTDRANCSLDFWKNIMTSGTTRPRSVLTPGQSAVMRRHPLCQPIN